MLPERNSPESQDRNADRNAENQQPDHNPDTTFTHVPNAHASGLGAMGRNDEKLPGSPDSTEERPESAY